jgi:hypothetical protein
MSERGTTGKSKRKSANKTRRDKTAFHDCTPFLDPGGDLVSAPDQR